MNLTDRENKVIVVLPAYNAAETLASTFHAIPDDLKKNVLVVDDSSTDNTVDTAKSLGIWTISHSENLGYGANQKTCYNAALAKGAEVVVMLHPDNQYDARVVGIMADLILLGNCDIVLGNRIRTRREAFSGGMPKWRYFINRFSTLFENLLFGQTLGDWHSGLRAFSREVLLSVPYSENSDDFSFDQQILIQAIHLRYRIDDIPIPARYDVFSSSISFWKSAKYGKDTIIFIFCYFLHKLKIKTDFRFRSVNLD